MPLYCYMISYYEYSDSEFLPLFHEQKFTRKEFHEICNKIFKEIEDNEDKKWKWCYPSEFLKYARQYGFRDIDIFECDTVNGKVKTYGVFEACVNCKYEDKRFCSYKKTSTKVGDVCEYYEKKGG